jgi:transmembrane sensor
MNVSTDAVKAAEWFARSHAPDMDPGSEQSWLKWIEEPGHQQAYENCELAWELSAQLRTSPQLAALLAGADATRPNRRVPLWQVGLAASVLAVGAFAWLFFNRAAALEYTTAVGEQHTMVLPDGSAVFLNTGSDVRIELSRHLRRVELVTIPAGPSKCMRCRA